MNLKTTLKLILLNLVFALPLMGQDAETDSTQLWKYDGSVSVGFSTVQLSNWAGGGENSVSLTGVVDLKAIRSTEKSTWTNSFNAAFGIARVGGEGNLFKKTDDQLVLGTNYNYNFSKNWSVSGGLELRTQFAEGYTFAVDTAGVEFREQVISQFFAPAYLSTNIGITYTNPILSATFSPASNKLTFVLEDSLSDVGAFGVSPGKKVRSEVGPSLNVKLAFDPIKNVSLKSSLLLFANYQTPELIDVDWETLLVFQVNRYITTSFGTRLIYDDDILIEQEDGSFQKSVQYKQALNINVGITF